MNHKATVVPGGVGIIPPANAPLPTSKIQNKMKGESFRVAMSSDKSDSNSPRMYRSLSNIYVESNSVLFLGEPQNYKEAVEQEVWKEAMNEEIPRVNFNETFAPITRMEMIRTILALSSQLEMKVYQLNIKSAFLNGELEEEVYVLQPKVYVIKGERRKSVLASKGSLRVKTSPRAWNIKIESYFNHFGLI
ncbi:hypothetical protein J1N35_015357 [Gossypium stocksii]|uniref:Reverse transcriptase Ty1/copia-type domain-containing protein n=1 Tax=Gossypium stocksii TaxID=47602 RepID=A0A9D4AAM0_9ROSI|nr:hypothetical protein J1N35_015357 [Gossypium stocksii]